MRQKRPDFDAGQIKKGISLLLVHGQAVRTTCPKARHAGHSQRVVDDFEKLRAEVAELGWLTSMRLPRSFNSR
jgi:hypothetical protein